MIYTAAQLVHLSQNSPEELALILINPNANTKVLINGIEILCGEATDETLTLPVIRLLIKHMNALVRESAMIGIAAFYVNIKPPQDIIDRLKFISTNDPSTDLKNYAKELLEILLIK